MTTTNSLYYKSQLEEVLLDFLYSDKQDLSYLTLKVSGVTCSTKELTINLESIDDIRYFLDVVETRLRSGK